MLHRHAGHLEAVPRIRWCINENALSVITGEVGAGKTVVLRAALAELDGSRHTVIYLPNPVIGARGPWTASLRSPDGCSGSRPCGAGSSSGASPLWTSGSCSATSPQPKSGQEARCAASTACICDAYKCCP